MTADEVSQYLSKVDLAVLPYIGADVSASGAIRELLANGLPVIASAVPAFLDVAKSTDAVKIFDLNDLESFKTAMHSLLASYSSLSKEALNYCQRYPFEKLATSILSNVSDSE